MTRIDSNSLAYCDEFLQFDGNLVICIWSMCGNDVDCTFHELGTKASFGMGSPGEFVLLFDFMNIGVSHFALITLYCVLSI